MNAQSRHMSAINIKRGLRFVHKRILDEPRTGKAECIVTRVARGTVYYKVGGRGASGCFPVEEFPKWAEIPEK